ncbi:MAG: DUF1549 and DUF1553 domain-containing protein, partial [Gemmataceae bacterium]|nr:DUF1549 and DUF1553 domain-containing protein [Gemmataceae bacterium]
MTHRNGRFIFRLALLLGLYAAAPSAQAQPVRLPDGRTIEHVDFERHVVPLLHRQGCNAGNCHGHTHGKGGLRLSLFGSVPELDFQSIVLEDRGRRVSFVQPETSLLLRRGEENPFPRASWEHQLIRNWIAAGAPRQPGSGKVIRFEVEPKSEIILDPGQAQRLQVFIEFADGSRQDMTLFSAFRLKDGIAKVSADGTITGTTPGSTLLQVSYGSAVHGAWVAVAYANAPNAAFPKEVNVIDREIFARLRQLNIVPAETAGDLQFLRRVTLDTLRRLPTPAEVRAFLADKQPDKRQKTIDALLADPAHAALWANKFSEYLWSDYAQMDVENDRRPARALQWHAWLRKRFAQNQPIDRLARDILCATSREEDDAASWTEKLRAYELNAPAAAAREYAGRATLDLFWRRTNPGNYHEGMAQQAAAAFLGVRLYCASCHKHPADRWTRADQLEFANLFRSVQINISEDAKAIVGPKAKILEVSLRESPLPSLVDAESGAELPARSALHSPRSLLHSPRLLGESNLQCDGDPRQAFANWLTQPDNPYFARNIVNRVWAHYMGAGLVEPVDYFAAGNPPSHPNLLDALAQDFVENGFDLRPLERAILTSNSYQLSSASNATHKEGKTWFSRHMPRRHSAEVLDDLILLALNDPDDLPAGSLYLEKGSVRLSQSLVLPPNRDADPQDDCPALRERDG